MWRYGSRSTRPFSPRVVHVSLPFGMHFFLFDSLWLTVSLFIYVSTHPTRLGCTICLLAHPPSRVQLRIGSSAPGPGGTIRIVLCVCVCVALFTGQMQKKHHIMCHFANNLLASIFPILQSPPDYDVVKWCETSVLNGMILLVLARFIQMHCLSSRSRCPRKKHEATSSVSFMDALGWAAMTILVLFFYF